MCHITYAIAEKSGPVEVKGPPVESVWPLAFKVGCEHGALVNQKAARRHGQSRTVPKPHLTEISRTMSILSHT